MEFMSEIIISTLHEHSNRFEEVMDIFFESSTKKEFASVEERVRFLVKYLGVYFQSYPELCFIALKDDKILGYCCGMPNTPHELYQLVPHLELFQDQYGLYPAHLHINCHAESRGQGVGALLMNAFETEMKNQGVEGVHVVTSPTARNVHFYEKLHYDHRVERNFEGTMLLLLGKTLSVK